VAHIGGKPFHVVRGVGEAQHVFADDFFRRPGAEAAGEAFRWNKGKLFDDIKIERFTLHFLTRGIIARDGVQICEQKMITDKASASDESAYESCA